MTSLQGQAHTITGDQGHVALLALRELVNLQKGSTPPFGEVNGASGKRSNECSVTATTAVLEPSIDGVPQADFQNIQILSQRRSVLARSLRIIAHGLIVFVIVGIALAWRSSDNETREIIKAWVSSLVRLPSIDAVNSPDAIESSPNADVAPTELTSNHPDQGSAQKDVVVPAAPVLPFAAAPVEVLSDLQQRLATISGDLATVQRTLEQLAAAQKLMAQDIANLKTAQKAVNQKTSSINLPSRGLRRKSASTDLPSETVVERNSGTVTTAPPDPPLKLH